MLQIGAAYRARMILRTTPQGECLDNAAHQSAYLCEQLRMSELKPQVCFLSSLKAFLNPTFATHNTLSRSERDLCDAGYKQSGSKIFYCRRCKRNPQYADHLLPFLFTPARFLSILSGNLYSVSRFFANQGSFYFSGKFYLLLLGLFQAVLGENAMQKQRFS